MTDAIADALAALVGANKVLGESCSANAETSNELSTRLNAVAGANFAISAAIIVMLDRARLIKTQEAAVLLREFISLSPNPETSELITSFIDTISGHASSEARPIFKVISGGLAEQPNRVPPGEAMPSADV